MFQVNPTLSENTATSMYSNWNYLFLGVWKSQYITAHDIE